MEGTYQGWFPYLDFVQIDLGGKPQFGESELPAMLAFLLILLFFVSG